MSFVLKETVSGTVVNTYATLPLAVAGVPTTLDKSYTILGNENVDLTSTGLALSGITTGSFRLTITFDVNTRLVQANSSAPYVFSVGMNNITISNCTLLHAFYTTTTSTAARVVLVSPNVDGLQFSNVVFSGGSYGVGNAQVFNSGQITNLSITGCEFKNFSITPLYFGSGTFTTGDYSQPQANYRLVNLTVTGCNFHDANNRAVIPTTAVYTNLHMYFFKVWNFVFTDNQFTTTIETGIDMQHCKNITFSRNYIKDACWQTTTSRYPYYIFNSYNFLSEDNAIVENNTSTQHFYIKNCSEIKLNNNTVVGTNGFVGFLDTCTKHRQHQNNIYVCNNYLKVSNTTAGLVFADEWQNSDNNYFRTSNGNHTSLNIVIGSTTYSPRGQADSLTTAYQAAGVGYDTHSYFINDQSTAPATNEIFNKGTFAAKPYYAVLPSSNLYETGDSTYGGTKDVRGFNKPTGKTDIGAYTFNATDPNNANVPPVLTITVNRTQGIKSDTTFSFTASAVFTGATASSWAWDFGDGGTSTSQNPTHQYTAAGTYLVACTVTDSNGLTDSRIISLTVYADGVEVIGGYADGKVFTGTTALISAITRIYRVSDVTVSDTALNSDVRILVKTTTQQVSFYYSSKPNGNYQVTIETDLTFTGNVRGKIYSGTVENAVWAQNVNNLYWKNISFLNGGTASYRTTNGRSHKFLNCTFEGSLYGLYLITSDGFTFDGSTFTNCKGYKAYTPGCTNITFIRSNFTWPNGPADESTTAGTRVQVLASNTVNLKFISCVISGLGNWDCFLKGSGMVNTVLRGNTFSKFRQQVVYPTNGNGIDYNAYNMVIENNIFNRAVIAKPAAQTDMTGPASRTTVAGLQFDYCFNVYVRNNTFYEDREGMAGYLFKLQTSSSQIFINDNIFFMIDSNQAGSGEYFIFKVLSQDPDVDNGLPELITDRNYFMFQDAERTKFKWGNIDNVSIRNLANAQATDPANFDPHSQQYASATIQNIINTTTFEPQAGMPILTMGAKNTDWDFDKNIRLDNGCIGAKEFNKTAFTITSVTWEIFNLNPRALGETYTQDVASYEVPANDLLNFTNKYIEFFKEFKWVIVGASLTQFVYVDAFNLTFTALENYNVQLTLTKNDNSTIAILKNNYFTVILSRPVVNFKLSKNRIFQGERIDFLNLSQFGASYLWTITNTDTNTSETFTTENILGKQFLSAAVYDVTLAVTNTTDEIDRTYSRVIHVVADFDVPYQTVTMDRHVFWANEPIKINATTRFGTVWDNHRWYYINSDTKVVEAIIPQKSPNIRAGKLPPGDYDIVWRIESKDGTMEYFKRHAFVILPLDSDATTKNVACTMDDTFPDYYTPTTIRNGHRIDGITDNVAPGTIIVLTGMCRRLELTNLQGTKDNPIVVIPGQDLFEVRMSSIQGIYVLNCKNLVIAGNMGPKKGSLGIWVHRDPDPLVAVNVPGNSVGLHVEEFSTFIRTTGIKVTDTGFAGMQMKTEPYGNKPQAWRGAGFQMEDTFIHHCEVGFTGGEGLYIGFTTYADVSFYYTPTVPDVNGNNVPLIFAHRMIRTKIWDNYVHDTGWDGIQVGCADQECEIHNNRVTPSGILNVANQSAGMSLNNGLQADVYNNVMDNNIIMQQGKGLSRIYNNFIYVANKNDPIYYIFDFPVQQWDYSKVPTTQPYAGQWNGTSYLSAADTACNFYNNLLFTNRQGIYVLNRNPNNIFPSINAFGNIVIYTRNSYNNFDPNKSPIPPTTMPQAKLVYGVSDSGSAVNADWKQVFNNIVRREDNVDDLELGSLSMLDGSISPGSAADDAIVSAPQTYLDMVLNYYGRNFSAEGIANGKMNGSTFTVGANTLPDYTDDPFVNENIKRLGIVPERLDDYVLAANRIMINLAESLIHVGDGVKPGGWPQMGEGIDGFAIWKGKQYNFVKGLLDSVQDIPDPGVPYYIKALTALAGNQQVSLSWTAPNNGGAAITDYHLYYRVKGTDDFIYFQRSASTALIGTVTGLNNGTDYEFMVRAVNSYGEAANSIIVVSKPLTPITAPGSPTNLLLVAGNGQVDASWTAPASNGGSPITNYKKQYKLSDSNTWLNFVEPVSTATSTTFLGLTNGLSYDFRIIAVNAVGDSTPSVFASITCPAAPAPPVVLQAQGGDGVVNLTWGESSDNGSTITAYKLYRGLTSGSLTLYQTLGVVISYADTGVANGTTYYYEVSSVNAVGESFHSNTASATPVATPVVAPSPVRSVEALPQVGSIKVSWQAPLDEGTSPITGYQVFRGPDANSGTLIQSVADTVFSYTDTTAANGQTYYYYVLAVSADGVSTKSNVSSATPTVFYPSTPQNFALVPGDGQIRLNWANPSSSGTGALTGFKIYTGTSAANLTLLTTVGLVTTYLHTPVANGTLRYYAISAINGFGEGTKTATLSATPSAPVTPVAPSAPQNPTATAGDNQVALTWGAPASNGTSALTSFKIYRGNTSTSLSLLTTINSPTQLNYTDGSAVNGNTYYYAISAVSADGESVKSTTVSATPTAPVTPVPPTAPQNLAATAGNGQVSLSWGTPSLAGSSPITHYNVYRGTASGAEALVVTLGVQTSYTDTGRTNGTRLYYKITATSDDGESPFSNEVSAVPLAPGGNTAAVLRLVSGNTNPWNPGATQQMAYVWECEGYNDGNTDLYPLHIAQGGTGQRGNGAAQAGNMLTAGLFMLIKNGTVQPTGILCATFEYIDDLYDDQAYLFAQWMIANYRIDPNRIYLSGLSQGGHAAFFQGYTRSRNFWAAIMCFSTASGSPSTASDFQNFANIPTMVLGGDADTTQPLYNPTRTNVPSWIMKNSNQLVPAGPLPQLTWVVKGGGHNAGVWDTYGYNYNTALFNWKNWLLMHSRNAVDQATNYVSFIESFKTSNKIVKTFIWFSYVKAMVDALPASAAKTALISRYNAVKTYLNGVPTYVVNFGSTITGANINNIPTGATGSAATGLVDYGSGTASSLAATITQSLTANSVKEYDLVGYLSYPLFGLPAPFARTGLIVRAAGGTVTISGLQVGGTYRIIVFGSVDVTSSSKPNELAVIANSDTLAHIVQNEFNMQQYSDYTFVAASASVPVAIKGGPVLTNANSVGRLESLALQTNVSNISSYGAYDCNACGMIIFKIA